MPNVQEEGGERDERGGGGRKPSGCSCGCSENRRTPGGGGFWHLPTSPCPPLARTRALAIGVAESAD